MTANAIETLREGIGAVEGDREYLTRLVGREAKRVQDAFEALAAVEALLEAAKDVQARRDDELTITKPETFAPMIDALDALTAAIRRVETGQ